MSLRLRILLTATTLVLVSLGGVLAAMGWIVQAQTRVAVEQSSARAVLALERALGETQDRLWVEARLLADRPGTRSVHGTDSDTISDHLDELSWTVGADWVVMADPEGYVIGASSGAPFEIDDDLREMAGVSAGMASKSWKGTISRGQDVAMAASHPVVVGEYVQSVVLIGRRLSSSFLAETSAATGLETVVFDDGGVVAASRDGIGLPVVRDGVGRAMIGEAAYLGMTEVMPGVTEGSSLRFWALVPEVRVTGPFEPLRDALVVMLGVGLAMALGVGAWLSVSMTSRIEGLVAAARVLKRGEWPTPFGNRSRDEIGLLQSVFDEMTLAMRTSRDRLVAMLEIDPLTELWNYRSFREKVEGRLASGVRDWALILMDVDQLERFNQTEGSVQGDLVLQELGQLVREAAGQDELAVRYGGNVFGLTVAAGEAGLVAERLRAAVEARGTVTVSVGVCAVDSSTNRADLLFMAAEMAVSQAKAAGRNRVRTFDGFELAGGDTDIRQFLQHGSYAAVRALAEAVDAKDEYTRGHSQRVADYGKELAAAGGFDSGFVELVYMTGTLHDVGKIGVPDVALKKPSHLTDEEFEMIKQHPVLGEKIVGQIPQLRDTLPGIRNHHERWDGRGYPDKMAGEEIPLIARILAVADTYDAMTSDRPYRKGLPVEVALAEIEKGAGTQFDPELARLFVRVWQAKDLDQAA